MFSEAHARRLRLLHERLLDQARIHQLRATALLDSERTALSGFQDQVEELEQAGPKELTTIAELAQRYALAAYLWNRVERQSDVVAHREQDVEQQRQRTMLVYQDLEMWESLETRIARANRSGADRIAAREADEAAIVRYTRAVHWTFAGSQERPEAKSVSRRRS